MSDICTVQLSPPNAADDLVAQATVMGTPVRVYLEGGGGAFQTSVLSVENDRLWLAPVFPRQGNLVIERLLPQLRLELLYAGLPYVGTCSVLATSRDGILLERPRSIQRVQRRRYYRVAPPPGFTLRIQAGGTLLTRTVLDVSGSGCAVRGEPGDEKLLSGAVEFVHLPVGPPPGLIAAVQVKRILTRAGTHGEEIVVGLEFVDLSAADRSRLISWVTETERSLLSLRSLDRPRPLKDVIVLLHDDSVSVRLRSGVRLSTQGVVLRTHDDDDLVAGATHPGVEVRLAGARVLRSEALVELTEPEGHVHLRFVSLDTAQRASLTKHLQD